MACVLVAVWLLWPRSTTTVRIGTAIITAHLAVTPGQQEAGLSNLPQIGASEGMLFIFSNDAAREFWMKDMRFNIDIIWLDSNSRVVSAVESAAPSSYPKTFTSPNNVRYVLEVPAGTTKKYAISPGAAATFSLPLLAR